MFPVLTDSWITPIRSSILACAREYLGTPFQHQGRLKGRAIDCVGLPILVGRELGLLDYQESAYPDQPSSNLVLTICQKYLTVKSLGDAKPGDVVCFAIPITPCHVGIITDFQCGGVIHAYSPSGAVVEHVMDNAWVRRIRGCFSFPGVD